MIMVVKTPPSADLSDGCQPAHAVKSASTIGLGGTQNEQSIDTLLYD